jgi:glycosyltransferase A (GT-A) superfamily protein (DUF2064 family)
VTAVLVVAKAPVAGLVKTRLGVEIGMERAADLAAAALLDTLEACTEAFGPGGCHLALDGDLVGCERADEMTRSTAGWNVFPQQGKGLGRRLRNAHEHVHTVVGGPVIQVGMDTPQAGAVALRTAARRLTCPSDAVLGAAYDGGWWLLGVGHSDLVRQLDDVPMSAPDTFTETLRMLERAGATVSLAEPLRDVDTVEDARLVASEAPHTRFAEAWR